MTDSNPRFALIAIPETPKGGWDFTDHVATSAIEMSLIHNVIIRALNTIHETATQLKKGDESSFIGYISVWLELVHNHHHGEETIIFPFLQTKFDMKQNLDQHEAFRKKMEGLEDYVKQVATGKATYDGQKIRDLVEDFGDILIQHLHEEIPTLSPERIAEYDNKELQNMMKVHEAHIQTNPMTRAFCLVLVHHDFRTYPNWPPMPGPIFWILKNIAYWRHSSYWKFAPFTRQGNPQKYITAV